MPSVIIPGRIIISDTVKPVLQSMIRDLLVIQIIPYGVGITKHVNIPIPLKVHRNVWLLQLSKKLCIADTGQHIDQQVSTIHVIFGKLRKSTILFLIKPSLVKFPVIQEYPR